MEKERVFNKNSHLITVCLDDEFTLIVNPYLSNAIKILNKTQFDILGLFDGDRDIVGVAEKSGRTVDEIQNFVSLLSAGRYLINGEQSQNPVFDNFSANINFWVHTTDLCNLRCRYCYIHTKDSHKCMEFPVIEKFMSKIVETVIIKKLKLVTLRLAGGEPFIRFDIWKSYICSLKNELELYNCKLNITFLTNLTLLTDEIIEFIKFENIGIGVSLDGLNQFHNMARPFLNGRGSFDIILNNIKRLVSNGITPHIMTVVSNDNLDGLFDFTVFLVENNFTFRYSIVQSNDFNYQKAIPVFDKIYSFLEQEIEKGFSFEEKHQLGDLNLLRIFNHTCGAGINTGTIYSDGNIYFCQQQVGTNAYLDSVYSNRNLIDIISSGTSFCKELSCDCQKCNYLYVCSGGCPLERINGKSPSCMFYRRFIPIIYKLIGRERLFKIRNVVANEKI